MHVHIKYVDEKHDVELTCTIYAQVQNTSLGINWFDAMDVPRNDITCISPTI